MKMPAASRQQRYGLYGRALRTLRAYRNLGQRDLADRSGFSYGAISKWERGEAGITTPNRAILAETLRVPLDVFEALGRDGDPLVNAMAGYFEIEPERTVYNYQQAARAARCCVNTFRRAVKEGIVKPRSEFRSLWFTPDDIKIVVAWQRERAVSCRSRISAHKRGQVRAGLEAAA